MKAFFDKLIAKFKDKRFWREYLKFSAVGIATTLLDFGIMALILYIADPKLYNYNFFNAIFKVPSANSVNKPDTFTVVIATGLGFIISFFANYIFSVFFVYQYGYIGRNKKGFIKFLTFALAGFVFHALGEFVGFALLMLNVWVVKIILSVIMIIFNYVTRKKFIFNINLIIDEEKQITL